MTSFETIRSRTGVMLTNLPTVAELNRADHCFEYGGIDPEDFKDWRCVASGPSRFTDIEDDGGPSERSNWDSVIASFSAQPVVIECREAHYVNGAARKHNTDVIAAWRSGLALVETLVGGPVLLVAPDMSKDIERARSWIQVLVTGSPVDRAS